MASWTIRAFFYTPTCIASLTSPLLQIGNAKELCKTLENQPATSVRAIGQVAELRELIELTEQVCNTARRRVLEGEKVPNEDKLFSIFETHTQLYKRGKAGQPIQYGRLVLLFEDGA